MGECGQPASTPGSTAGLPTSMAPSTQPHAECASSHHGRQPSLLDALMSRQPQQNAQAAIASRASSHGLACHHGHAVHRDVLLLHQQNRAKARARAVGKCLQSGSWPSRSSAGMVSRAAGRAQHGFFSSLPPAVHTGHSPLLGRCTATPAGAHHAQPLACMTLKRATARSHCPPFSQALIRDVKM